MEASFVFRAAFNVIAARMMISVFAVIMPAPSIRKAYGWPKPPRVLTV